MLNNSLRPVLQSCTDDSRKKHMLAMEVQHAKLSAGKNAQGSIEGFIMYQ